MRRDGGELYYMTQPGRIYAVAVHPTGGDFAFDPPRELFRTRPLAPIIRNPPMMFGGRSTFSCECPHGMRQRAGRPTLPVTTSCTKALQQ